LITLVALALLALTAAAGAVTLTVVDRECGQRALAVLKVLLGAIFDTGGVLAVIIRLRQAGLL
jgi:hypothetical protein